MRYQAVLNNQEQLTLYDDFRVSLWQSDLICNVTGMQTDLPDTQVLAGSDDTIEINLKREMEQMPSSCRYEETISVVLITGLEIDGTKQNPNGWTLDLLDYQKPLEDAQRYALLPDFILYNEIT